MNRNATIVALLVIVNITVLFNTFYIQFYVYKVDHPKVDEPTGFATLDSTVSLCFDNGAPRHQIHYPNSGDILNGTVNVTANISMPGMVSVYNLSFYIVNTSIQQFFGEDAKSGSFDFNSSFNTASVSDGNCNYRIRVVGDSNESICSPFDDQFTGYFTIDNNFVEPTWNNFMNYRTTNFSQFTRFSNLTGVDIGNGHGAINFTMSQQNFDNVNLDQEIAIGSNSINISLTSVCLAPISAQLSFYNLSFSEITSVQRNGETCSASICGTVTYAGGIASFTTDRNGIYVLIGELTNQTSNLTIYDDTDLPRNQTKKANNNVSFYANYTTETSQPLNGTDRYCQIEFNTSSVFSPPTNMTFNHSSFLYEYTRSFGSRGNKSFRVYCNDASLAFQSANVTDNITITNTAPLLIANISNLEMNQGTVLTGLDLNDFFEDVDADTLTFNNSEVTSITIVIDSNGIVSFIPASTFFGLRRITFFASDHLETTASNNMTLTVVSSGDTTTTSPSSSSSGGGGGGGGGASFFVCQEEWYCDPWTVCVDQIRTRSCFDLNNCKTFTEEPPTKEECEYISTCYNGMLDEDEEFIDCGGPCVPCFTCFDRQKNQNESDIDCGGGNCKACAHGKTCNNDLDCQSGYCNPNFVCSVPSCSDGFQNQGEGGIDCGGPCPRICPIVEQPTFVANLLSPLNLFLLIALLVSLLFINVYHKQIQTKATELYYRFAPAKRQTVVVTKKQPAQTALLRIRRLQSVLSKSKPAAVFSRYCMVFERYVSDSFNLKEPYTQTELRLKIQKSKLDSYTRNTLMTYNEKLKVYKTVKLRKQDVDVIMEYGKKLIYHIMERSRK